MNVAGPGEIEDGEEIERVTLELPVSDVDFIARVAEYRNTLAKVQKKKIRKWSRKSLAESLLAAQVMQLRKQFADMISSCGPIPDPDDEIAMVRYAKRVIEWTAKLEKSEQ